ncbi:hypothetical protein BDW02DRAFT_64217 [Decorospora gaudefroyi]|uniref:Uncharacterized protein n=1 Tax=Decorospora gaudefroyi TaxID=184978 RepID=A0A6A5K8A2_9PLEO|nr:hypothetical protein BDW02DRAFT_64217 [Decorospora gaudefroyi]
MRRRFTHPQEPSHRHRGPSDVRWQMASRTPRNKIRQDSTPLERGKEAGPERRSQHWPYNALRRHQPHRKNPSLHTTSPNRLSLRSTSGKTLALNVYMGRWRMQGVFAVDGPAFDGEFVLLFEGNG